MKDLDKKYKFISTQYFNGQKYITAFSDIIDKMYCNSVINKEVFNKLHTIAYQYNTEQGNEQTNEILLTNLIYNILKNNH